jgi:anti-anti-sigma factor
VLAAYVGRGPRLVLDLSGVEFMDCATLRVVQSAYQVDDRLLLVAPSSPVLRLLELTGADVPYYDSLEQALGSQGSPSRPASP